MARPTAVTVEDMDNELRSITRHYRGHTYVMTELPYNEYQKTLKKATVKQFEGTPEETERFDNDAHTALIIGKTVTEDGKKVGAEALYSRGTRLVRQLIDDARNLHFDEEPEDEEIGDGLEGEATPES